MGNLAFLEFLSLTCKRDFVNVGFFENPLHFSSPLSGPCFFSCSTNNYFKKIFGEGGYFGLILSIHAVKYSYINIA